MSWCKSIIKKYAIVGLDEIVVTQEINLVKNTEQDWIDNHS